MLSPYKFFSIYRAVELHFTTNYDYFKYLGKSKTITKDTFDNRKDRQRFIYYSQKLDCPIKALEFCVFNFIHSENWLYKTFDEANEQYILRKKYFSNFRKNIKNDYEYVRQLLLKMGITLNKIVCTTNGGHKPPLLQALNNGHVSLEFVCILDSICHFSHDWESNLDPLIVEQSKKIASYTSFVLKFK